MVEVHGYPDHVNARRQGRRYASRRFSPLDLIFFLQEKGTAATAARVPAFSTYHHHHQRRRHSLSLRHTSTLLHIPFKYCTVNIAERHRKMPRLNGAIALPDDEGSNQRKRGWSPQFGFFGMVGIVMATLSLKERWDDCA